MKIRRHPLFLLLAALLALPTVAPAVDYSAATKRGLNYTDTAKRHLFAGPVKIDGEIVTADAPRTTYAIGAAAGTNVTAAEYGIGPIHWTVLTLAATPVTMVDEASTVLYGSQKVYDLPTGLYRVLGAAADISFLVSGNLSATADGDVGLGTAAAGNNNALAGTEQNLIPTTTVAQLVDSAGPADAWSTADIVPIGTPSTAADIFLNVLFDDADHNGGSLVVSGTITITWVSLIPPV